jgi:hypothetical protein
MKVFISHQVTDSALAGRIDARLRLTHGVSTYLDLRDPHATTAGDDLGEYLRRTMGTCSHLLAVVSPATQTSWWVPWEIGVATEKDYPISTFTGGPTASLPEYLRKWPYLKNDAELDLYVTKARVAERTVVLSENLGRSRTASQRNATREFHLSLKSALGQG